jgi:serine kinase of HPr protein (carbohydrate metabolism regulator)
LLALLSCAGKPAVNKTANAGDDPRCEKFYEFVNKRMDIMGMEEFEYLKKSITEELGLRIDKLYDAIEVSIIQKTFENYETICNEAIACNQKRYCISFKYSNGDVWQFIEF